MEPLENNGWTAWRGVMSSRVERIENKLDTLSVEMIKAVSALVATQDNYVEKKDYNTDMTEVKDKQKRVIKFYAFMGGFLSIMVALLFWYLTRLDK